MGRTRTWPQGSPHQEFYWPTLRPKPLGTRGQDVLRWSQGQENTES